MRKPVQLLAVMGVVALTAGACGSNPAGPSTTTASEYKACMVTDTGGIDDRSFNASAWKGMQDAEKDGKVKSSNVQSTSENDYVPNINALISQKCD
ncbi:MAG TPA: BMP family ABC transporter substrate-binding protein, partial [Mycobacteriales bacterium]